MTRFPLLLALALGIGACDSAPSAPPADASASPSSAMAHAAEKTPFQITNSSRGWSQGETVVLELDGQTFEIAAGEAYVISQALGRASFNALDESLKEQFPDYKPGSQRDAPRAGDGVILFQGVMYGGGKRPPPPPPPDWNPPLFERPAAPT